MVRSSARVCDLTGDNVEHPRTGQVATLSNISAFTLYEFFVLGLLKEREMLGIEVVRSLSAQENVGSPPAMGIVYPLLKTLVKDGALRSRQVSGTPRIYYSLTDQGRMRLLAIAKRWASINDTVQSLAADVHSLTPPPI